MNQPITEGGERKSKVPFSITLLTHMLGEVGKLIDRRGNLSEELLTASKGPEFGNRPETTRIRDVGALEHMLVNIWGGRYGSLIWDYWDYLLNR